MKRLVTVLAFGIAMASFIAMAQDDGKGRQHGQGGGQGGQGGEGKRPMPPIIAALDTNGDGVIDEKELANATASLKKLDKNGDGKLTMDEIRPPRPGGAEGEKKAEGDKKPEAPKKADDLDLKAPEGK